MTITKATGQSSLVAGSWHDVTLGHEGLTLLSKALAMDAAHGDAYAVVTPEQQVSILYAGAPFWGKKLADPQLDSLSYFQDELAELRDVRTGADTLAAMAAPADPPELTVETRWRSSWGLTCQGCGSCRAWPAASSTSAPSRG